MRAWVPILCLATACAVRVEGVVRPVGDEIILQTIEGRERRLDLREPSAETLRFLDGEGVDISGRSFGRRIRVASWELVTGTHGMQAFHGTLTDSARGIGVADRRSGAFYIIDEGAVDVLIGYLGQPVVLEGYVEGAQALHVVYYRVLADPNASEESR